VELRKDANDYPEQIRHWQQKALDFSKQIYISEMAIEEKEDQVGDLIEYKQIQDGKIDEMEKEAAKLRPEIQKSSEKSFRRDEESKFRHDFLKRKQVRFR
jgi:SLT domain-containing protein